MTESIFYFRQSDTPYHLRIISLIYSHRKLALYICMPKSENQKTFRRVKSVKNIYVNKIYSLSKVTGESYASYQCLNNTRRAISFESREALLNQRRQNNKDAAKKARLRKKIYMKLLEDAVENLQQLNEDSKELERISGELLEFSKRQIVQKKEDELDQYLIMGEEEKAKASNSALTIDFEKEYELNRIVKEIQKIGMPHLHHSPEPNIKGSESLRYMERIMAIEQHVPQIYIELKSLCEEHASLHIVTCRQKSIGIGDPYICKTLMEQYYSQTLCRKDIKDIQVHRYLNILASMQAHCSRVELMDDEKPKNQQLQS